MRKKPVTLRNILMLLSPCPYRSKYDKVGQFKP